MSRAYMFFAVVFTTLTLFSTASAQSGSRKQILEDIASKRAELSKLEAQFLAPAEEDRIEFADLLSQPRTGLIRLLPRDVFESEAYQKNLKTIVIRGGGAYYSFTRLTHEYGYGSDIELDSNHLSVGFAGCDYGLLTKLGDVPLQSLSVDDPTVMPLAKYTPAGTEPEARIEQRRFSEGTTLDGVPVSRRRPVEINTTYVLRSIDYRESDVLVGLRVVRKDSDGSVIIAWKLLEKYPVPELNRNSLYK